MPNGAESSPSKVLTRAADVQNRHELALRRGEWTAFALYGSLAREPVGAGTNPNIQWELTIVEKVESILARGRGKITGRIRTQRGPSLDPMIIAGGAAVRSPSGAEVAISAAVVRSGKNVAILGTISPRSSAFLSESYDLIFRARSLTGGDGAKRQERVPNRGRAPDLRPGDPLTKARNYFQRLEDGCDEELNKHGRGSADALLAPGWVGLGIKGEAVSRIRAIEAEKQLIGSCRGLKSRSTVTSIGRKGDGFLATVSTFITGTLAAAGSPHELTFVSVDRDEFKLTSGRWRIQRTTALSSKRWVDGKIR